MASVRDRAGRRNVIIIVSVLAVALVLGLAATLLGRSADPAPTQEQELAAAVERRTPSDPNAVGPVDAPVTVVMFSDFQCGYCALWTEQTLPAVMDYVDEGKVRIEWRDLALFGDLSDLSARAGYAAGLQGRYAEFNQALFKDGKVADQLTLTLPGLADTAGELGLDVDRFMDAVNSDQVAAAVTANQEEALNLGVRATPTFIIAGTPVSGAQPTDQFLAELDKALEAAA